MFGVCKSFAFFFVVHLFLVHRMLEEAMYRFFDFNILCPALGLAVADIGLDFRICIPTWHV